MEAQGIRIEATALRALARSSIPVPGLVSRSKCSLSPQFRNSVAVTAAECSPVADSRPPACRVERAGPPPVAPHAWTTRTSQGSAMSEATQSGPSSRGIAAITTPSRKSKPGNESPTNNPDPRSGSFMATREFTHTTRPDGTRWTAISALLDWQSTPYTAAANSGMQVSDNRPDRHRGHRLRTTLVRR